LRASIRPGTRQIPTLDLLVRLVAEAIDQPADDVYLAMTT